MTRSPASRIPIDMPAGGRGYTRPPSLISLWSTAPFLLNNTVGPFEHDPSVEARMRVFQASIEQMLWPEKRAQDPRARRQGAGRDRPHDETHVADHSRGLRAGAAPRAAPRSSPRLFEADGDIRLGPIPAGIPVNLLANVQPLAEGEDIAAHYLRLARLLLRAQARPADAAGRRAPTSSCASIFADLAAPLLALEQCPDFVVNRGHYFGTAHAVRTSRALSDDDKRALIAFLKTF